MSSDALCTHIGHDCDTTPPPMLLANLHKFASERGNHPCLWHKQRGRWVCWSWSDAGRELEHWRSHLREHGRRGTRLALSGHLEPAAVFLALAAHAEGWPLLLLPLPHTSTFDAALALANPERLFFTSRDARPRYGGRTTLLPPATRIALARAANHRARLVHREIWIEADSGWTHGMENVLRSWLRQGHPLIFAEHPGAALRDRCEFAPRELLLSPGERHHAARLQQALTIPQSLTGCPPAAGIPRRPS